jgi:hypothetical protein
MMVMAEEEPFESFESAGNLEPTKVELSGPNVLSTFDTPPRADAVRTQEAAIRKHLRDWRHGGRAQDDS